MRYIILLLIVSVYLMGCVVDTTETDYEWMTQKEAYWFGSELRVQGHIGEYVMARCHDKGATGSGSIAMIFPLGGGGFNYTDFGEDCSMWVEFTVQSISGNIRWSKEPCLEAGMLWPCSNETTVPPEYAPDKLEIHGTKLLHTSEAILLLQPNALVDASIVATGYNRELAAIDPPVLGWDKLVIHNVLTNS